MPDYDSDYFAYKRKNNYITLNEMIEILSSIPEEYGECQFNCCGDPVHWLYLSLENSVVNLDDWEWVSRTKQ